MDNQDEFGYNNSDAGNDINVNNENESSNLSLKDFPKKIKLEITTTFEGTISALAFCAAFITAGMLFHFSKQGMMINPFTLSAIVVSIVLLILRFNIDEYYVLDLDKKALMLRKKLFSNETYTEFASFRSIEATVGNGRFNNGGKNSPGYWEYRAEIMLDTGKVVPIDDWHKEDLAGANSKAKNLADITSSTFVSGKPKVNAKPILENGKHTFLVKEKPSNEIKLSGLVAFFIISTIVAIMAVYVVNYL